MPDSGRCSKTSCVNGSMHPEVAVLEPLLTEAEQGLLNTFCCVSDASGTNPEPRGGLRSTTGSRRFLMRRRLARTQHERTVAFVDPHR